MVCYKLSFRRGQFITTMTLIFYSANPGLRMWLAAFSRRVTA